MNLTENQKRIRNMLGRGNRLDVDIDEVRKYNPRLSNYIKNSPIEAIKIFEEQLNTTVRGMQDDTGKGNSEKVQAQSNDA